MKNTIHIFIICLSTIFFSQSVFAAKLFLVGGALNEDNASIFNALMETTGKSWNFEPGNFNNCSIDWSTTNCPKIAVVVSASDNLAAGDDVFNNDDMYFRGHSYYRIFQKWGFSPKEVRIAIDNYKTASATGSIIGNLNYSIIKDADVVFFNGGDQVNHARSWLNDDGSDSQLMTLLRQRVNQNKVIISGTSAGTAVQGQTIYGEGNSYGFLVINDLAPKPLTSSTFLRDDREGVDGFRFENNGGKTFGFNFLSKNINFDTHFEARGRLGRMIMAMKSDEAYLAIGVDENTAIYIDGDKARVLGENSVFIADQSEANFPKSLENHFNTQNIRLSLLTAGDQYNLVTKKLISSKPKISTPQYNGKIESQDMLGPYVATILLTHLVDQTENMNDGTSDFSQPGFYFQFRKDALTEGYHNQNAYTVENALLDILDN